MKLLKNKTVLYSIIIAIIAFILVVGSTLIIVSTASSSSYVSKLREDLEEMYDGTVDEQKMNESIAAGIVAGLGDPHSQYFTQEEYDSFEQSLKTSFKGIGVSYNTTKDKEVIVLDVFDNSAAQKAGIYPGDIIKEVNGTKITKDNYNKTGDLIKEKDDASLVIYRPSDDKDYVKDVTLTAVDTPSVTSRIDDYNGKKIAYIDIDSFSDTTGDEFIKILKGYEKQKIDGLVIDVRNNGGGYLDSVSQILNEIVTDEKPYLITKTGDEVLEEMTSKNKTKKEYPITLVQNENSASASEVLSGALLELNKSEIIGHKSYGKGSVQQTFPLDNNQGAVKVTTEHWFTPDDNTIDGVGISPTIEISDKDKYLEVVPILLTEKLKLYSYSTNVELTNQYLSLLGYDVNERSNGYDSLTQAAISEFQSINEINVTGIVDAQTADKLYREAKKVSNTEPNDIYLQKAYETIK